MSITQIGWIRSEDAAADAVLAYAGRTLANYVRRMCGEKWDVLDRLCIDDDPGTAWIGICDQIAGSTLTPALWDDGFAIWYADEMLHIAGRNARSVLFGVYAFLETQGVRFLRPGVGGEVIPKVDALVLPEQPVVEQARYRHRGLCIEGAPSLAHALEMVDWCAKKRMNTIFLQFLSSCYFYNLWVERPYNPHYADQAITEEEALAYDDQVIASMKKRGIILHRVGHGWTGAAVGLPRSGWVTAGEAVQPEYVRWLAELDGKRALFKDIPINTELCYSHTPAFDGFVETIVQYCEVHPELDVVHVWLSDATNNKCECAECAELSISDWYAKIINALSKALYQRVPKMRFVFLCYIELLWAPEKIEIDEQYGNTILMFAPIARCYGHGLADPVCDDGGAWPRPPLNQFAVSRQNAFYVEMLRGWRKAFGGDSFDFDYHLMWANWAQMTDTVQARILHADLQQLQAIGLDGIVSCQSFRAFYPSGLAMAVLAESLWNPEVPWKEMRRCYLEAAYGAHVDWVDAYLDQVESFLDTGDPHWRTPPFSNADEAKLAACMVFLQTSLAEIELRCESTPNRAQDRSLDLLAHHARFLQFIVQAYRARLAGQLEQANEEFDRAIAFLRETEPEYSTFMDTMLAVRFVERAKRLT
ncbi:MAG: DUF4838 domain-containing protein [Anaerolineae bacterium]|nr:DUF4838 domain-containing protein [Anaerolineae bacterium]